MDLQADMPIGDMHRRRRSRNVALALFLTGLALLFFVVTVVKMQGGG